MAAGNITEQVAIIGKIAADGDIAGVVQARSDMVRVLVMADPLSSVKLAAGNVNAQIAYMAGFLPPNLGNEALRLFNTEHPIFGKVIPDDLESALAAGKQLGKQFALRKQIEEENAKKLRQAASLGVVVPDGDEEVSSDAAAKLMNAVRAKRAMAGDTLAAKEIEDMSEWEAARNARVAKEKLAADAAAYEAEQAAAAMATVKSAFKAVGVPMGDEETEECPECEDYSYTPTGGCSECGYNDPAIKAAAEAKAKAEAEEDARIKAEIAAAPKIEYDSEF